MSKCYVTARITAKAGMAPALREEMLRNIPLVRSEHGCIRYDLLTLPDHEGVFLFNEVWEDKAALQAHAASDHMAVYHERTRDMLAGPASVDVWSAVDAG